MVFRFLFVFDLLFNLFRITFVANCWERAVPLAFHFCCFHFSAVLMVGVSFPFGVKGWAWNSIVSVPDHCILSALNWILESYIYV